MLANRVRQPAAQFTRHLRPTLATGRSLNAPWRRLASGKAKQTPSNWITTSLGVAVAGTAGFLGYSYLTSNWKDTWIDSQLPKNEVVDINDLRADFIQEKRSLKSPGVYTWGSNEYKVVDPGSDRYRTSVDRTCFGLDRGPIRVRPRSNQVLDRTAATILYRTSLSALRASQEFA